ncbi:MAG TPA: response regulator, partial [Terrimicrobiaceae bacterium]
MKPKLLIVDDDEEIRTQMKWALGLDYEVLLAGDRESALAVFNSQLPPVVILDLGLPPRPNEPEEGLAALADLLVMDKMAKVIIISGQ